MPITITMPKLSPTMEAGVIAKWHKQPGDKIEPGDLLFEVATDKATLEYNALDEGYLRHILVDEGQEAYVHAPVAITTDTADASLEGYIPQALVSVAPVAPPLDRAAAKTEEQSSTVHRVKASPLAKKVAKQEGIDLTLLQGSGPGGRIVVKDLRTPTAVVASPKETKSTTATSFTPMRRVIAQRLQEAKSTIPHFYVQQTIDADPLVVLRAQLSGLDYKVSFNDCVVRAVALALKEHPQVNSSFDAEKEVITHHAHADIAVAVSVPGGLITPIIPKAETKSLLAISQELRQLAHRAKEGKLTPAEYQGGSFTLSNLGMFGISSFFAIINPPQVAILAVGGIADTPVVKEGVVVAGKTLELALSADHRVVDGVEAALFLKAVQKNLENPISLFLD